MLIQLFDLIVVMNCLYYYHSMIVFQVLLNVDVYLIHVYVHDVYANYHYAVLHHVMLNYDHPLRNYHVFFFLLMHAHEVNQFLDFSTM